jgi:AraC-like DNA-binding protein
MTMTSLAEHLGTGGLPDPKVEFGSWQDAVRRDVLQFRFECEQPRAFAGAIRTRTAAGVSFIQMACDKHAAYRDRTTISRTGPAYYVLTLQLSGGVRLSQDGRVAVLRPGTFALYDSAEPATITSTDGYRSMCLRFPKALLADTPSDALAERTATAFDADTGFPSAVWEMVLGVNRHLGSLGGNRGPAVGGVMDLVAVMLRTQLGTQLATQQVGRPAERAAVLERVQAHIDAHLADPWLNPTGIARAHYVSPRHLHGLFAATGSTVASWIRGRRIARCRRDLADPQLAHLPVATIAARWGFTSASHFGQVFKRETGQTPAEFRRGALA